MHRAAIVTLVAIFSTLSTATAQTTRQAAEAATGPLPTTVPATQPAANLAQYAALVKYCQLTDKQLRRVTALVEETQAYIKDFEQGNRFHVLQAKAQATQARQKGDAEALKVASDKIAEIYKPLNEFVDAQHWKIMALLTPEQRNQLEIGWLADAAVNTFKPLGLNEEQQKKITAIVEPTAKELAGLTGKDYIARRQQAGPEIIKKVKEQVLTAAQVARYEAARTAATKAATQPARPRAKVDIIAH